MRKMAKKNQTIKTFEEMDEKLCTLRRLANELANYQSFTTKQKIEFIKMSSTIDDIRAGRI